MKFMKKRLKRVKTDKKEDGKSFKLKSLFKSSHLWEWAWGIGLGTCLSLLFLLPSAKGITLFNKLGMIILITLFIIILFIYWRHFYPRSLSPKLLFLSLILIILTCLMGRVIILLPNISIYFIPLPFLSILFSLFFEFPLSLVVTLFLSLLFSINAGSLPLIPVLMVGGIIGAYSACFIHERVDLSRGGIYIGVSNVCAVWAVGLLSSYSPLKIVSLSLWGIANGLFSSILALTLLPYLETYFGITTDIKLLELSNPNHSLLRRLSIEAPGTYHHAVIVASLAEAAAESIRSNPLLCKVGAYYHDIGKVLRPHFFFENTGATKEDYHERVTPNLSSTIIISHVKDGVELAQETRLPQDVIDIIEQHHGKGLMAYFYRKALLKVKKDKESINEESFRYAGPKPQTKEAGIVMLADSVEADFRFSPSTSSKGIEAQIKRVVENKMKDGQLEECDLTLKEIADIIEAFTRVLTGLVHTRRGYPVRSSE
ncbi:MAG: HDIG domain-containing protein [Candidatus Aerophobetes bacterium]|nr:HDIG domain-containing protein [Candidatus Aerophobetes bacterium]